MFGELRGLAYQVEPTLRQIAGGGPTAAERRAHFSYADTGEHREGISAFMEKRQPRFQRG